MAIETPVSTPAAADVEPTEEACAGCGRIDSEWSDPVSKDDDRFCCVGCLDGSGCTCAGVRD